MKDIRWLSVAVVLIAAGAFAASTHTQTEQAMTLYKTSQFAEASHAFEAALGTNPPRSQRKVLYLYLGKSYESSNRLDKALSAYEEAMLLDRKNWRRHRDLGQLYEKTGLFTKALESYEEANRLKAQEPSVELAIGRIYRKIGLYQNAAPWLEKSILNGINQAVAEEELSYLFEGQGRFQEAAQAWSETTGPGERLFYLAALAGDARLLDEARRRLRAAHVPASTIQTYENLVQLLALSSRDILAGKTNDPTLKSLFKTHIVEGK